MYNQIDAASIAVKTYWLAVAVRGIAKKGLGAKFKVNLKFIPLNQFLEQEQLETIDPNKLVQVVDCIGTTRATIPQINNQ